MAEARFTAPPRRNPSARFNGNGRDAPNFTAEVRANIEIGETETLPPSSSAYVENVGTNTHQIWNIGIPRGYDGEQGEPGQNAKIIIRRL